MARDADQLWDRILERTREVLPENTFRTWFSGTRAVAWTDGVLRVVADSRFHGEWVEDKYGQTIGGFAREIAGPTAEVRIEWDSAGCERPPPQITVDQVVNDASPRPDSGAPPDSQAPRLCDRFTFERFVVGSNNRLAQAASVAVAERPARSYNPLFLHGATGLGKTHLMQAVANRILNGAGRSRISYVPAEQFVNEMVAAIRGHTTDLFRAHYRNHDLVLVDDVQFLGGKERSQEEFFHTFNELHGAGCQIVLASDRPPKELKGLEDRLVSRFEWGLVAGIDAPDYETRVAILRNKAEEDGLPLDPDVLDLIARNCSSSVRQLEGAVIKLMALSSLTNQDVDLGLARSALRGMASSEERAIDVSAIRRLVADAWGVTGEDLASKRRTREVAVPRQAAMYLARELLGTPYKRIGRAFGGRDHSTVIHSVRTVEKRRKVDSVFRDRLDELAERLRGGV